MSLPRYAKYKHAGTEWLGDVPYHWNMGKLRHFSRIFSGGTPDSTNTAYWQDGAIPWLNSGSVNDRLITKPSAFISAEAFAKSSAKWVPKDALVMALAGQGKTKGMVAQLAIESTCNQSMAAIIPNCKLNARFLFWWLDSKYQPIRNLAGGDLRDGLNLELIGGIPVPVIPLSEQNSIAQFLDREAVKIDELVSEQLRLIELLREKRQVVICHTVTKGLNSGVKMKPSDIQWLENIPESWEVKPLRSIFKFSKGLTITKADLQDEGILCVNYGEIHSKYGFRLNPSIHPLKCVSKEFMNTNPRALIDDGDFIFADTSEDLEGSGNFTHLIDDKEIFAGYHTIIARPKKNVNSLFLAFLMDSSVFRSQIQSQVKGVKVFSISQGLLKSVKCWLPTFSEQNTIAEFLDNQTSKIDDLIAEIYCAIDLLQQRRTALISDAVTGKIDVRPSRSKD